MRIHKLLFLPLPLLLLASACGSEATTPAAFNVGVGAELRGGGLFFQVWNRGRGVAYVDACDHKAVGVTQRLVNGVWQDVNGAVCPATLSSAPLALQPAASVASAVGGVTVAGDYRVTIIVRDAPGDQNFQVVESEPVRVRLGDVNF